MKLFWVQEIRSRCSVSVFLVNFDKFENFSYTLQIT